MLRRLPDNLCGACVCFSIPNRTGIRYRIVCCFSNLVPSGRVWLVWVFFSVLFSFKKKKLFVDSRSSRRLVLNIYLYEENRFDLAMAPMKMVLWCCVRRLRIFVCFPCSDLLTRSFRRNWYKRYSRYCMGKLSTISTHCGVGTYATYTYRTLLSSLLYRGTRWDIPDSSFDGWKDIQ